MLSLFGKNINRELFKITIPTVRLINSSSNQNQVTNDAQEYDILYKTIVVEVRGHDTAVLNSYEKFVRETTKHLNLNVVVTNPHRFIERWSILKSIFSNKKHFRQYEMRTYFKEFHYNHLTGSTCDTLLEYIQRNIPEGVSMYVHRTQVLPLDENLQPPINDNKPQNNQ